MEENIIQTENLTKIYKLPGEEIKALNGVNFSIKQGDFLTNFF